MSEVTCFWIEPLDLGEESFRRYNGYKKCPSKYGYHNASVVINVVPYPHDKMNGWGRPPSEAEKLDPRWPSHCECGYAFQPEDEWQHNMERYYHRKETGEKWLRRSVPPGAMWNAEWWPQETPDGLVLTVMLPDGIDWMIDGPATNGGRWTRTGVAPKITARPSILTPNYHGFLTDGVLKSC